MSEVKDLIKLYSRKRYYKLLREGLKFLGEHSMSSLLPNRNGEMFLTRIRSDFEIYFNGVDIVQYEIHHRVNSQQQELRNRITCPLEHFNFETMFNKYDVIRSAENIGDLILLFVPDGEITIAMILLCHNQSVMSTLINRYGEKKFFAKLPHNVLHKDGETELLDLKGGPVRMRMVKVIDPTTKQTYLLKVPPHVRTCKEAVAWTFGLKAMEYNPKAEA